MFCGFGELILRVALAFWLFARVLCLFVIDCRFGYFACLSVWFVCVVWADGF